MIETNDTPTLSALLEHTSLLYKIFLSLFSPLPYSPSFTRQPTLPLLSSAFYILIPSFNPFRLLFDLPLPQHCIASSLVTTTHTLHIFSTTTTIHPCILVCTLHRHIVISFSLSLALVATSIFFSYCCEIYRHISNRLLCMLLLYYTVSL
jgi:hypothetical protein